jgi:DNA polymerase-1
VLFRSSSSEPNLHNIPKPGDDEDEETTGKALRRAFIASPGNTLICADYSQIQYRLLAHYSKEPILIKAFIEGQDVHEATGKALGVGRKIGKTLNFAAIFGAFPEKIAQVAHCTEDEAKEFLARYWRVLPGVKIWMERVRMLTRVHRHVKTIFGRVIPIADIDSTDRGLRAHAERTAINYIIQGGEADIMKKAMCELNSVGLTPILQVHDELHFDVPYLVSSDPLIQLDIAKKITGIKQIMEGIVKLDVPLTVTIGHGSSWYEAH